MKSYEKWSTSPCRASACACAIGLAAFAWSGAARAVETAPVSMPVAALPTVPPPAQPAPDARVLPDRPEGGEEHRLRIGALTGVGFPRPIAVEGMVKFGGVLAAGVEYGTMPTLSIDGVTASLWSIAADARLFLFHGPFFIGLRAGHQHISAATTITVAPYGPLPEDFSMDSWFLNPRVGFLWTSKEGLALGIEAGVQFPVGTDITSSLPLSLAPSAQQTANDLGNAVVPTIDLLRIGLLL